MTGGFPCVKREIGIGGIGFGLCVVRCIAIYAILCMNVEPSKSYYERCRIMHRT